jgi:hypothetical protein
LKRAQFKELGEAEEPAPGEVAALFHQCEVEYVHIFSENAGVM